MSTMEEDLCPDCARPVALFASHGCGRYDDQCGARDAKCWDCVYECGQRTIALLRAHLERYTRNFGIPRYGVG